MNILILGNGFDLAHGLKTKYTDFLDFCAHYIDTDRYMNILDLNLKKELDDLLKPNLWYLFFDRINAINHYKSVLNTWIDFEALIFDILNLLNCKYSKLLTDLKFNLNKFISYNNIVNNDNVNDCLAKLMLKAIVKIFLNTTSITGEIIYYYLQKIIEILFLKKKK
jgi:hypothetical protein